MTPQCRHHPRHIRKALWAESYSKCKRQGILRVREYCRMCLSEKRRTAHQQQRMVEQVKDLELFQSLFH